MQHSDLLADAIVIDETLITAGVYKSYEVSAMVTENHIEPQDVPYKIMEVSAHVVNTCFRNKTTAWAVFKAAGLPARMAYYFQVNRDVPERVRKRRSGRTPRQVICNTTGHVYLSADEAATAAGVNITSLYAHLRRDPRYSRLCGKSYSWYYIGMPPVPMPPSPQRPPKRSTKTVRCVETGETWPSLVALAAHIECSYHTAIAHMKGRQKTLKGRTYRYVLDKVAN